MGTVYKARHRDLDRLVAIKVLSEDLAADPDFRERFKREATIVAQLTHPNIVAVYDIERHESTFCIVMEYVEGTSLQKLIEARALGERDMLLIGAQVARALHYAHERNIIHRDVKPDNVLVTANKLAKITDFGIARWRDRGFNTQTGTTMGTPRFMSPEQITGRDLDGRSDLYSLGVCLYYALAGVPPFDGDNHYAVATKHLYEEPTPPTANNPAISAAAEKVIMRALAKDPDERFQTGEEMARALEEAAGQKSPIILGTPTEAIPQGETRRLSFETLSADTATPARGVGISRTPTSQATIAPIENASARLEAAEEAAVGRPPRKSHGRREAWRQWLTLHWGIIVAVVVVAAAALLAGIQWSRQHRRATAATHLATPVRQAIETFLAEMERFAKEGKLLEAWQRAQALTQKYADALTDNEQARIEEVERAISALPVSEAEALARRRYDIGMRFFNNEHRLALARAYLLGAAELGKGEVSQSARSYLGLLEKSDSATTDPIRASELFERAQEALRSPAAHRLKTAEKDLMEAVCLAPDNYDYWLSLAELFAKTGRYDDARVILRYVEANAPRSSEGYKKATQELRKLQER